MRSRFPSPPAGIKHRDERPLLPGTGIVLTGAASLVLWAVIAGIAAVI